MNIEQQMAEEATGIRENRHGLGTVYDTQGYELTPEQAQALMKHGRDIEIPNAGAGSYRQVFIDLLGYKDLKVIEQSSSAGDWTFGVFDGQMWIAASQNNRHPRFGFQYSMARQYQFSSFDELVERLQEG